jgi:hypothetical protein
LTAIRRPWKLGPDDAGDQFGQLRGGLDPAAAAGLVDRPRDGP